MKNIKSIEQLWAMDYTGQVEYLKEVAATGMSIQALADAFGIKYHTLYELLKRRFPNGHPFNANPANHSSYYFKMDKKEYENFLKACDKRGISKGEGTRMAIREFTERTK